MTLTRNFYTSLSSAFNGDTYIDDMAEKGGFFFNNIDTIITSITNSGNDYTITITPALVSGDVQEGMGFYVTPNADNTDAVRIRITVSGSYYDVKRQDGSDFGLGQFSQNNVYHLKFIDGEYRAIGVTSNSDITGGLFNEQVFLTSGLWTKPLDYPEDALVEIWLWGGGGGGGFSGATGAGGGGGACVIKTFKISELSTTETVTIGAGGAAGTDGGDSTFGSLITAYGGGRGFNTGSGGGAGLFAKGGSSGGAAQNGGEGGGGGGAPTGLKGNGGGGEDATVDQGGGAVYGGGGGGDAHISNDKKGGNSIYGGGGGGGVYSTTEGTGGKSLFGGDGATATVSVAEVPGGGGAGSSDSSYNTGANGKCIVRVLA